jgi:hypothetical protein
MMAIVIAGEANLSLAGGSASNVQTTVAMSSKEAMEAFSGAAKVAKSFKSAGK